MTVDDEDYRRLDAKDAGGEWQREVLLDHGEESARLLLLILTIDGGLLDQLVQLPRAGHHVLRFSVYAWIRPSCLSAIWPTPDNARG